MTPEEMAEELLEDLRAREQNMFFRAAIEIVSDDVAQNGLDAAISRMEDFDMWINEGFRQCMVDVLAALRKLRLDCLIEEGDEG